MGIEIPDPSAAPPASLPPSGPWARARARWTAVRRGGRVAVGRDVVLGQGIEWDVARGARVELGAGVAIGEGCRFHVRGGTVRIGAGVVLGEGCVLRVRTGVVLEEGVRLADGVGVLDHTPAHDAPLAIVDPAEQRIGPVCVEAGARIGPRTVLEPGVRVGAGAQVGANLVVSEDVPAGGIFASPAAPARSLRG